MGKTGGANIQSRKKGKNRRQKTRKQKSESLNGFSSEYTINGSESEGLNQIDRLKKNIPMLRNDNIDKYNQFIYAAAYLENTNGVKRTFDEIKDYMNIYYEYRSNRMDSSPPSEEIIIKEAEDIYYRELIDVTIDFLYENPDFEPEPIRQNLHVSKDVPYGTCPICLNTFKQNQKIVDAHTPEGQMHGYSGHRFHKKCIMKWCRIGNEQCPLCRHDINCMEIHNDKRTLLKNIALE